MEEFKEINPRVFRMRDDEQKEPVRIANIADKKLEYSACSEKRETYRLQEENSGWVYLGEGIIWTINGVNQKSDTKYHFWKYKAQ